MSKLVTILTPTYNRAHLLNKLYSSLRMQTSKNFIWMIVDDGSTDNTINLIQNLIEEKYIDIILIQKNNGGKHTALNIGISKIKSTLTFIVDSDDYLTEDAVEAIEKEWEAIKDLKLCGIGFLRGHSVERPIVDRYPIDHAISDYNTITKNKNVIGDKAEVWVTRILRETPFPEFHNEKFFAEGYVWSTMAFKYNMYFVNKVIYIADYLEDGLTKAGRRLRISCPLGGMKNASILMSNQFVARIRLKNALLFICYGYFAGWTSKKILYTSQHKFLILILQPFGYILYKFWKYRYLGDK